MKSAYIITNRELVQILGTHLQAQGYNTSGLSVRCTSTNVVVAGITKNESFGTYMADSDDEPDVDEFDDESEEDNSFAISEAILSEIGTAPKSISMLASLLDSDTHDVRCGLGYLGEQVQAVAPAREDGETVSMWMKTGTEQFALFVEAEAARIGGQTEKLLPTIMGEVPKFYERCGERPQIVEKGCESLTEESDREDLRRDSRAVFYRLAEQGVLEHRGHGWRAGKTESDNLNVASLQGAVREVLIEAEFGMSRQGISEKLPGFVEGDLLRHAIKRMDDVYEQDGLLYRNG